MTMKAIVAKLRVACRRFAGADEGNTLITFALAFIPLVALTGAAVDYSRASALRTSMQAAADTAALMVAQDAPSQSASDVQIEAQNYYKALFTRANDASLKSDGQPTLNVTATYSGTVGATVVIKATATYNASFLGVLGERFRSIPLAVTSTATFGNSRLRVALVLDNTGSMADAGKITALKNALHNGQNNGLIDILKGAAVTDGDVYVSIIPFVKDVNLGSTNSSADWVYWDDTAHQDNTSWDAQNGTCSNTDRHVYRDRNACLGASGSCSLSAYTTMSSCQAATGSCSNTRDTDQNSCVSDGVCSNPSHTSSRSCTRNGGTWSTPAVWRSGIGVWTATYTWTPKAHSTWNGCVMDRGDPGGPDSGNYDTDVTEPSSGNPATQYAAEQYSACPQAVMGLSYQWDSMITEVHDMVANGNTNQAVGLQLGWMSLVGGGPFTMPAEDPNYKYSHVVILLSDGLNTQDRWYGTDTCDSTGQPTRNGTMLCIDYRQRMTCDNVRNAGVTIYTVQVNTDNEATSSVLQYCAGAKSGSGDPSYFFLLTSADQIVSTFQKIGTDLSKLRIAR